MCPGCVRRASALPPEPKLPLSRFSHGIGVRYGRGVLRAHDLRAVRGARDDEDPERFSSVLLPSHLRLGGRHRSYHLAHLATGPRHVVYFMRRRDAHRAHRAGLKDEGGRIRAPNARMRPLPKNGATPRLQW